MRLGIAKQTGKYVRLVSTRELDGIESTVVKPFAHTSWDKGDECGTEVHDNYLKLKIHNSEFKN